MKEKNKIEIFKFENNLVELILLFRRNYKKLPKIIKKGELYDDTLIEYYLIVKTLYGLILSEKEVKNIVKDKKNKLSLKDFEKLKDDLLLQIEWCEKQMNFRNKVRQQTKETIVDYKQLMEEKIILAEKEFTEKNKKEGKQKILQIEDKKNIKKEGKKK